MSQIDEQHLDADELNSYVANALPPKTRARYMEHLVDCSSCRKMVAQLSAAEGPVAVRQPSPVVEPSGLKSFFASLFSPLVLRYAVPALGVIVIAVIGIVMFQQQQQERGGAASVAQVTNTEPNKSVPESSIESTTPTTTPPPAERNQGPRAGVMADAPPAPKPVPAEEAERPDRQAKAETKAAPAADQSAATTDTVQPITTDGARADQANKNEAAKKEADTKEKQRDEEVAAPSPSVATAPGNKATEPQRAKAGETTGAGAGVVTTAPQSRQELRRARRDDSTATFSNAETRAVAGREFVKRGNVWFDLAYNSSQSITNVTRGTEQYRVLVADEPAIHTIAENLKSEFVVVWKGRTYRVR